MMKELLWITKVKIKRAGSANLKSITSNKLYCRLTVTCFEMSASFYPQPLPIIKKSVKHRADHPK
jgi:hypothetical protein